MIRRDALWTQWFPDAGSAHFPPAVNDKKEMWDGSGEELADRLYQKIVDMKFV